MKTFSNLLEDLRQWFNPNHPKGGWKRINSKGEAIGPCAREPGEAKPKCMSNEKRAKLSKKERASAVAAKRKHDPNPERKGGPINVSNFGKGKISEEMENLEEKNVPTSPEKWAQAKAQAKAKFDVYPSAYANGWAAKKYKSMGGGWKSVSEENGLLEKWTQKYKSSIDCGNPKGFSQKAHCDGKEKNEEVQQEGAVPATEKVITVKHKTSGKTLRISAAAAQKYRTMGYHYHPVNEAKDEGEYDQEGDMAKTQLQTIARNAKDLIDMVDDNENMPEWVQSKITLATDYITTVRDYLQSKEELGEEVELEENISKMSTDKLQKHWDSHKNEQRPSPAFASKLKMVAKELANRKALKKEEVEQIEELSDNTVASYVQKRSVGYAKKMKPDANGNVQPSDVLNKMSNKHKTGISKAMDRLVKPVSEANDSDGGVPTPAAQTLTATGQPKLTKVPGETKLVPMVHEGAYKSMATDKEEDARLAKKGSWKVEGKWKKSVGTVTDKSGAKHTPMSRARDLARKAAQNNMAEQSNVKPNPFTVPSVNPGQSPDKKKTRQMEIVREAMKVAKKKKKEVTEAGSDDKFIADPELNSQITKSNP